MSDRYHKAFTRLDEQKEGAFVPFVVLGDPDPETSLEVIRTLVHAGADALELGIPFSDPIADGPTIQAADLRALQAGTRQSDAWSILSALREAFPELPMGLLVYANLVEARGATVFFKRAAQAGVDSVLIADVPTLEAEPYIQTALANNVLPVLIATPTASDHHLMQIARGSRGYTYLVTRCGITGVDDQAQLDHRKLIQTLAGYGAPPVLMGFGISRPEHVRAALAAGAAGAISGSAVVSIVEKHLGDRARMLGALEEFVKAMKAATR